MSQFFDIDVDQEELEDFREKFESFYPDIEYIAFNLHNDVMRPELLQNGLVTVDNIKTLANSCQIVPLVSSLDALENILHKLINEDIKTPSNFVDWLMTVIDIAMSMANEAADFCQVDFRTFAKLQSIMQPLGEVSQSNIEQAVRQGLAIAKGEPQAANAQTDDDGIDLFGEDEPSPPGGSSDIVLFDDVELFGDDDSTPTTAEPPTSKSTTNESKPIKSAPRASGPSMLDDSVAVLNYLKSTCLKMEHSTASIAERSKIQCIIALTMNRLAGNPVADEQMKAAVYAHDLTAPISHLENTVRQGLSKSEHEHAQSGGELLLDLGDNWLPAAQIVMQHHEKVNGSGFPDRMSETEICSGAKILAICDAHFSIAKAYNSVVAISKVQAHLEAEKGVTYSSFWVKIYADAIEELNANKWRALDDDIPPKAKEQNSSKTVLCVDDDPDILLLISSLLEDLDINVVTTDGYEKAIEIIQKQDIDLLCLDLEMPGKGGYWFFDQRQNDDRLANVPVIVVSGHTLDYIDRTTAALCEAVFEKPIDIDQFTNKIASILQLKVTV